MKKTLLLSLFTLSLSFSSQAQQIPNGDMELWDAVGTASEEPQNFNSNKTGSTTAQLGPQTCFRDGADKHGGLYSARMETKTFIIAVVNGSMTTGVINAPTTTKSDGYIGTTKYQTPTDIRRMAFNGRPDSIVGWYHYTKGGTGGEQGKFRAILHVGHYYDPETATSYHPDSTVNKIADCVFLTPSANVPQWTRFALAFNYVDGRTPDYLMINSTASANQNTNTAGSKLWLDDLSMIYNPVVGINEKYTSEDVKVYSYEKNIYVDFLKRNNEQSTISIYDLTGKLVKSQKLENNKFTLISMTEMNAGLYMYYVTGSTHHKSGKLIIE